jgi:hypothetical protein
MSNCFRVVNELRKIRQNGFDNLKPPWLKLYESEKPATVSGAGFTISAMMSSCT